MSTSLLYHTQGINQFKHIKFEYKNSVVVETIERKRHICPNCGSHDVSAYMRNERIVTGMPVGGKGLWLKFAVHTIYCHQCRRLHPEKIPFLSSPRARCTKQLEKTVFDFHSNMSIHGISQYFGLRWHTIKEIQLRYLRKKYSHISYKDVTAIGVDEIMVGHKQDGGQRYFTIVRNTQTGDVLWVGNGKGVESLDGFAEKLRRSNARVEYITMDLGQAYTSWAAKNLPEATIIYDHFHVVKLMNDGLDKVRRSMQNSMDEEQRRCLKNQRYLLLRNLENLDSASQEHLAKIKSIAADLGIVHTFKEDLRSIYTEANNGLQARFQLSMWIQNALGTGIKSLQRIAMTFASKIDGIVAFWDTSLSNSHMEGFNSKIRTLIKMANGYADEEFFKLKIFDLPNQKIIDLTCPPRDRGPLRRELTSGLKTT